MSKLRQMEVFVAVVEAGSFADAASEVGMSAVMVGRHIQSLEKTLNTTLIQRTTRRQSITGEGRLFYEEAKLALEQVKYAFSRVEASSPEPSGLLRITAPMTLGVSLVGPLVSEFMQRYSHIQIELVLSNEVVDLYETSFDLAFRISELIGVNLLAKPLPPNGDLRIAPVPGKMAGTPIPRRLAPTQNSHPHVLEQPVCLAFEKRCQRGSLA
jgi:DNA-binding transcriptional LysR family regulator